MTDFHSPPNDPIDAVITWVDGSTQAHRAKRTRYMQEARLPLNENARNPHRWHCSDEILYCVQSIGNFAPWTRKIWIVIDSETPDLSSLSESLRAKVHFVYHDEIFGEYRHVLPTFNSLAIESMLWRIDGLSERFLYFNDDVFLTAPLQPADVFQGDAPVLRGQWVDHSDLADSPKHRDDPAKFNCFMEMNAAQMVGFAPKRVFSSAHVVHPLRRTVMAQLFDSHFDAFMDNIAFRFRDLSQFLPQGLHNHACVAAQNAVVHLGCDHLHIKSGQGIGKAASEMRSLLETALQSGIKFLCINDLPQLEIIIPEAKDWLGKAVGGFPAVAAE